ncbi:OLC1v1015251C2 [Oldenlandia corymbosa var. corymbosa]|uniref:OLC1v1015251C2 n=1 Tax=Oldenlandia corymbosa var. corymbosa TaxID=529605 RepID=A0AAV1E507_OLDCO|nr:OLC1v1015251C2 [Oldenlandia corymbosa var. corymbosa]
MVSVGSKALLLRQHRSSKICINFPVEGVDNNFYNQRANPKKKKMGRKAMNKKKDGNFSNEKSGAQSGKHYKSSKHQDSPAMQSPPPPSSFIRKQVDPETAKYFAEIANVVEGGEIDFEERSVVCGNALEEARGKEVELATDYIISHTLQTLLESCSVEHLCGFLRNCSKEFAQIAMDRSGSHVAETALKALAFHLQDSDNHILIEETLTVICKMIVANPIDTMCNCHGSHVLRSLLSLCRGVPLDSTEFHSTKSSVVLAERLNTRASQRSATDLQNIPQRYPELLRSLVSEMLNSATKDMVLQCNQYSSLVLQTALKLLAGEKQLLLQIVPIILGCSTENAAEGNLIPEAAVRRILNLVGKTAFSHLMEVVLEVAPDTLYDELFLKVFKDSLFSLSSDQCGNFVVQALISHARTEDQMELIWADLGARFKDLLDLGRSGVVASIVAACRRLHTHENECAQALAAAVCAIDDSPRCIVPRILFLDNYIFSEDKPNWSWPHGTKMHVLGSLLLQSIFGFPNESIQSYVTSITSLEESEALSASKDPCGSRVVEAFLSSNATVKQKRKLIAKLRGHFAELSVHPSGSFTIEKCFSACNLSLRETIVSELLPVQKDLANTKQGPYLLKKFDVEGFAKRPDLWKSRQSSRQTAYKEFYDAFGPSGTDVSGEKTSFLAEVKHNSQSGKMKDMRKQIDNSLVNTGPKLGTPFLAHQGSKTKPGKSGSKRSREGGSTPKVGVDGNILRNKKKQKS